MRILLVNNSSLKTGGADISIFNTGKLLENKGHRVAYFYKDNRNISLRQLANQTINPINFLYSFTAKSDIGRVIDKFIPHIVHLNNFYHHLSPAIIDAIYRRKIPMIMTLRDYKLVCAVYKLWRNGRFCEDCRNKKFSSILKNNCNLKGNFGESLLLWTEMNLHHNILNIYDKIDAFISPSKFLIKKFKEMGLKRKIEYLPNFVFSSSAGLSPDGASVVYFGRLAPEKGLEILLDAIKQLAISHRQLAIKFKIIGDGPEKERLKLKVKSLKLNNVVFTGWLECEKLVTEIRSSLFTVLPAIWYENNPRSILESFALGKPVVASNIGGIPELVDNRGNGLLVKPGDADDLMEKICWLLSHHREREKMGKAGCQLVKEQYNEEIYYRGLMKIYKKNI